MKEENKNISDLASSFEALSKVVQSNSVALAPQFANIAEVTKIIEEKTAPLKAVAEAMQGWQSSFALTLATITEGIPDLSNMRNAIQFPDLSEFAPVWARLTEIQPTLSTQIKIISEEVPLMQSNISSFLNVIDFKFDVFSDFVKDINGLSANVAEGYIKKDAELKIQYNNIMEEYKPYFTRKDILTPNNYYEFKDWFFLCLYPDAYFYAINIVPNDFILFDEYRVNQIENYNWTDEQERERLNSERQKRLGQDNVLQIGSNYVSKDTNSKTYTTKDYVMAYIIECFATDVKPPSGEKSKLEEIGKELLKPINGNGNTFYKKFNDHFLHISKTDNQYLIENWGSDWQSIVLDLAKDKEEVSNYLKNNR